MSVRLSLALLAIALATTACDDPVRPKEGVPGRVVVLNGRLPTGVTVVSDTGSGIEFRLDFAEFDGASFSMRNDTVASAASKGSGDILYVGSLKSRTVVPVQLPAASNPGGVVFGGPNASGTQLFVALRDSSSVARVVFPTTGGAPTVQTIGGAGVCPVDVVVSPSTIWSLDSNQRCTSDYATLGPSRLISLPMLGSADTLDLPDEAIGGQRAFILGDSAFVMSSGDYFSVPGALTKVNLTTGATTLRALPADRYAASFRKGHDGRAYVTAFRPYPDVHARVYAIDLETMTFTGTRVAGQQHLRLVKKTGSEASCFAATADQFGNVYCLENGNLLSTLYVFNAAGDELRSATAGSLAYDIDLR